MTGFLTEAWGFKNGEDVEYRTVFAALPGSIGYRDPENERYEWHRAKIIGFTREKTILVKVGGSTAQVNNPKLLRRWKPPQTPDEIERFLEG